MTTNPNNPPAPEPAAPWAAILAAAIGCFAFGVLVDLAEASKAISNALNFYNPTGDLSGKSTLAVLIWLSSWLILNRRWKSRPASSPGAIFALTLALLVAAFLAVFPPFFGLFAAL